VGTAQSTQIAAVAAPAATATAAMATAVVAPHARRHHVSGAGIKRLAVWCDSQGRTFSYHAGCMPCSAAPAA
jgi:hypothetical protein